MNLNTPIIHPYSLSPPSQLFKFLNPNLLPKLPSSSSNSHLFRSLLLLQNPLFNALPSTLHVTRALTLNNSFNPSDDASLGGDLVIEASTTRILKPALTLHHGIVSLMDALQEFKLNPPHSDSGLIRFQVAVPPSANALDWFCCQPESSGVFPLFYLSKQSENPTRETDFFTESHGVFGIGAAVSYTQSSSSSDDWNSFRRYLLVDSLNITAYGFIGGNYDVRSSFMKHDTGSFYFIIPQIELKECEGFCILAGMLVWSDSFYCNFEQALCSYEISLYQATNYLPAMVETYCANMTKPTVKNFNMVEAENLQMVYVDAPSLGSCNNAASIVEMVSPSS